MDANCVTAYIQNKSRLKIKNSMSEESDENTYGVPHTRIEYCNCMMFSFQLSTMAAIRSRTSLSVLVKCAGSQHVRVSRDGEDLAPAIADPLRIRSITSDDPALVG